MNFKKLISAFTAAAVAVTMTAVSAFAATVELDSEYVGSWGAGKCIPKTELEAVGGDVKVTLDLQTRNLANTADQFLLAPMDYDNSWTRVTDQLTGSFSAKEDGFICINEAQTSVSFVITADTIASLGDSGLGFQVQNIIIKSAELEAGSPEGAYTVISEDQVKDICFGTFEGAPAAQETPAAEEAPAPVQETVPAATGNTPAAAMAAVMVAAGAAAIASKRK